MNYLSIVLGSLLVLGASNPVKAAFDCIPNSGCPKEQWPPKCCRKPPCAVFHALQVSRAYRNLQRPRLGQISRTTGMKEVMAQQQTDIAKVQSEVAPCPDATDARDMDADFGGRFQPDPKNDCQISWMAPGLQPEVMSEGEALNEINACSELIQAKYAFGQALQPYCALQQQHLQTPGARIAISLGAVDAQIRKLEEQLQGYWNACTITFSAETAQRVAEDGVEALRDANQLKKRPKDVPARAKKHGKRR
jgi:hypothetical protein